ncbi:hypothetical protein BDW67DRAFT_188903 [Aspergillus spinulosporus]
MRMCPCSDQGYVEQLALVEAQAAAELLLKISWHFYQNILHRQEETILFDRDAEALDYGIRWFPALDRVTVTPAVHGWIFTPLYETPLIRVPQGHQLHDP